MRTAQHFLKFALFVLIVVPGVLGEKIALASAPSTAQNSPEKIVYCSRHNSDLFVMNADGSNPTKLPKFCLVPAWSNDGTHTYSIPA